MPTKFHYTQSQKLSKNRNKPSQNPKKTFKKTILNRKKYLKNSQLNGKSTKTLKKLKKKP
jgi:hypothetical protein